MPSLIQKLFPSRSARLVRSFAPIVAKINAYEEAMKALSDDALKGKTTEFRARIAEAVAKVKSGKKEDIERAEAAALDEILPEAFAAVREASRRTLGQRHFDVQLIGGIILHKGMIAEMRTGEGKTLVATLPVYLNALLAKGVHVVTVNDYLSRRDAGWMGQIYAALGLSVGVLNHEASFLYDVAHNSPSVAPKDPVQAEKTEQAENATALFKVEYEHLRPCRRPDAYAADITYGTNNEYGFDYLRDNIEYESFALRQRPFYYAVVDEIDSILIDEARTPLIISAPTVESEDLYGTFAKIARSMVRDEDFTVDEKFKTIAMLDSGINKAEKMLGVENIYTDKGIKYVHHLETAIRAKALFELNKEYVVKDNEIVIVDEFTGRLQPGRRWSEGLHQAIEAKEGVKVQKESRTFASITFQNYFRLYKKLAGMTGTALTSAEEFHRVYGLDVVDVPTNKPINRNDLNDLIFRTEHGKFKAIARSVKELNKTGQPVLIGTVSIEKNELLSEYLKQQGVPHTILNAKPQYAEKEGEIVAQAGRKGAVTIATNMAGRGVDIKLGGALATPSEYEEVKKLGGLFVLGTERHEARRIDNQLRGRSGRQGDPGATQFFVSLEDSLMRVFASDMIGNMMERLKVAEDEAIENRLITRSLESAQSKIEGFNFDARKHVLEYDDILNLQRKTVYDRRRSILLGGKAEIDAELATLISAEEALVMSENAMRNASDERAFLDAEKAGREGVSEAGSASQNAPERLERKAILPQAIEAKKKLLGENEFYAVVRRLLLQTIDLFWVEHLEVMEYTRGSVNLRAYGQRDPLVEYKREGLRLFREMQAATNAEVIALLPHIGGGAFIAEEAELKRVQKQAELIGGSQTSSSDGVPAKMQSVSAEFGPGGEKIGRNDPCPCGSGKKWKNCGAIGTDEHKALMASIKK